MQNRQANRHRQQQQQLYHEHHDEDYLESEIYEIYLDAETKLEGESFFFLCSVRFFKQYKKVGKRKL